MMAGILTGCTQNNAVAADPVTVEKGKVAVIYYSWSPDGNTRFAAQTIAAIVQNARASFMLSIFISFACFIELSPCDSAHGTTRNSKTLYHTMPVCAHSPLKKPQSRYNNRYNNGLHWQFASAATYIVAPWMSLAAMRGGATRFPASRAFSHRPIFSAFAAWSDSNLVSGL